jgi:hypothetical protein
MFDYSRGLIVEVYKHINKTGKPDDCTNGGLSSQHDEFLLLGVPNGNWTADSLPDMPKLKLVQVVGRNGRATTMSYKAVPLDYNEVTRNPWYMFGGNFVYTCDSRFTRICGYPIQIHDRKER